MKNCQICIAYGHVYERQLQLMTDVKAQTTRDGTISEQADLGYIRKLAEQRASE